jgi:GNAT superfamily N-acetyltransferase
MQGFIAYSGKDPIGWCNVNSKDKYSHIMFKDESEEGKKIAAIVCFLIAPNYRKKGISRLLLKEACRAYKNKKFDCMEAYPIKNGKSDAHNYHGPYSLFLSEGFLVVKELEQIYVMRKKL